MNDTEVRQKVREGYAKAVTRETGIGTSASSCCGPTTDAREISSKLGYTGEQLDAVPEDSNLGLGCGNPTALATLREGETVLDLGSGAGFDSFLAANKVGDSGKVIGVDMTPEMLDKARANAVSGNYSNVEFRLGEIEHLPVADNTVDVIISNCVINLAPQKGPVFAEAFRVLKPGGRLLVSDIVLLKELSEELSNSIEAYVGCIGGAILKDSYLYELKAAGFEDVKVVDERPFSVRTKAADGKSKEASLAIEPGGDSMSSIEVSAIKV